MEEHALDLALNSYGINHIENVQHATFSGLYEQNLQELDRDRSNIKIVHGLGNISFHQ